MAYINLSEQPFWEKVKDNPVYYAEELLALRQANKKLLNILGNISSERKMAEQEIVLKIRYSDLLDTDKLIFVINEMIVERLRENKD